MALEQVGGKGYATEPRQQTLSERISAALNGIQNQADRIEAGLCRMTENKSTTEPVPAGRPEHIMSLTGSAETAETLQKRLTILAEHIERIA